MYRNTCFPYHNISHYAFWRIVAPLPLTAFMVGCFMFNPFSTIHEFCCLLSCLLMQFGSLYCKKYEPRSGIYIYMIYGMISVSGLAGRNNLVARQCVYTVISLQVTQKNCHNICR